MIGQKQRIMEAQFSKQKQQQQSYRKSRQIKLFQFTHLPKMDSLDQGQSGGLGENSSYDNHNNLSSSLNIAGSSVHQLLRMTFEQISQKQLLTHYPQFVHNDFMAVLNQFICQSAPSYGAAKPSKIIEQDPTQMIKIQKDNLSPKQLPSEHPEKTQTVKDLDFMSAGGSRKLSMTNRSSFFKRKPSQMSQLPPGPNTQRAKLPNNSSFNSNNPSPEKNQKSASTKKDTLQNFTSLIVPQDQDPQIVHLRQKAHFHQKQREKEQSIINQRLKQDQQKVNKFQSQYGENGMFTFDFEGETIGSETNKDQRLKYYAMKVGIKNLGNKYRTIYKHLQTAKDEKNDQTLIKPRNNQHKKSLGENAVLLNATSDIPMFHRQSSSFAAQVDPLKLKILEYKRLYGKKFSRYDKNSMTLDVSTVIDKKGTEEDFFASKKHLTDSLSINKSRSSSVSKEYAPRKLALPKLQGKYKVLDRYDQL